MGAYGLGDYLAHVERSRRKFLAKKALAARASSPDRDHELHRRLKLLSIALRSCGSSARKKEGKIMSDRLDRWLQ